MELFPDTRQRSALRALPRRSIAAPTAWLNARRRSVTFVASGTWIVPPGATVVESLRGIGMAGYPESGSDSWSYNYDTYQTIHYNQNNAGWTTNPETFSGNSIGMAPADTCTPVQVDGDLQYYYCYRNVQHQVYTGDYVPPSYGPSPTILGKTFLGGYGGPFQKVVVFENANIPVVPGAAVPVTVPDGCFITIVFR